jgi:DNA replication and repair protein RecF
MINDLTLNNFRCFSSLKIKLSPGINFFYGKNGSGKTSILEAINLCSSAKSFKSGNLQSLISIGEEAFNIKGFDNTSGYSLKITKEKTKPISIQLNNTKTTTSKLIREFPSTSIHNNTFSFADAPPDFRRKLLDKSLFIADKQFSETWFAYYRCLKQRNALLKSGSITNIGPWDKKLASLGNELTNLRGAFFDATLIELKDLIKNLDKSSSTKYLEQINVIFFSGWDKEEDLYNLLKNKRDIDLRRKSTTAGPHKSDIKFLIEDIEAKQILSRGEQKLFSILWCCAQHEVLRKQYNINAVLIIDDIKSELDDNTFKVFINLLDFLNNQIIFSCIDDHFSSKIESDFRDFKKFHVEQLK